MKHILCKASSSMPHSSVAPHTVRMRNMPSSLDKCLHAQGTAVAPGMDGRKAHVKMTNSSSNFHLNLFCSPIFPLCHCEKLSTGVYEEKGKARAQVRTQWPIDWHLARAPARGLLAPFAAPARIGFVGTCNNLILPGEKGGRGGEVRGSV